MSFHTEGLSAEDLAGINALHETFGPCLTSGDVDGLVQHYTEDTVVMPPNMPPVEGREAVREWIEGSPKFTSFGFTIHEIVGMGGKAFVRGQYRMTVEIPGVPEPVEDVGSFLEIRERQPDGRWLLARDIFNSDLAAAG